MFLRSYEQQRRNYISQFEAAMVRRQSYLKLCIRFFVSPVNSSALSGCVHLAIFD
jgi:hypothetical protein